MSLCKKCRELLYKEKKKVKDIKREIEVALDHLYNSRDGAAMHALEQLVKQIQTDKIGEQK